MRSLLNTFHVNIHPTCPASHQFGVRAIVNYSSRVRVFSIHISCSYDFLNFREHRAHPTTQNMPSSCHFRMVNALNSAAVPIHTHRATHSGVFFVAVAAFHMQTINFSIQD